MSPITKRPATIAALGGTVAAAILFGAIIARALLNAHDGLPQVGRAGSGLPDLGRPTSAPPVTPPGSTEHQAASDTGTADPTHGTSTIDPCHLFQWSDFPEPVRPSTNVEPEPVPRKPDDVFDTACTFAYFSDDTTQQRLFSTFVAVGHTPNMSADPQSHQAEPAEWGGRPGTRKTVTTEDGTVCTGLIPIDDDNIGGVSVINSLIPHTDPCAVVDALLTTLASRTP
ncbi:hypothetical protein [Actinophytocola xanthii]|uniref:hypothetical protein n=1 Tax=Actinophytocola xanthii TaxID=1912961 RepID=UPI001177E593|nr:hypothetical protein [Actinophytocola xanthii]